jgi:hypothetical protein
MKRLLDFFEEADDPDEPVYDPVHLGAAILTTLTAIGALYWLFWSLLVFEGGLPGKAAAAASVLFTDKTMSDFEGAFAGLAGNLGALVLTAALVAALFRAYRDAERAGL